MQVEACVTIQKIKSLGVDGFQNPSLLAFQILLLLDINKEWVQMYMLYIVVLVIVIAYRMTYLSAMTLHLGVASTRRQPKLSH